MLKRRARECITRCKWNYMRRACRPCPAFRPQTGRIIKMGVAFSSLPILLLIRQPSGVGLSMLALPQGGRRETIAIRIALFPVCLLHDCLLES